MLRAVRHDRCTGSERTENAAEQPGIGFVVELHDREDEGPVEVIPERPVFLPVIWPGRRWKAMQSHKERAQELPVLAQLEPART
ncbi:hypothetical protein [Paracoccus mutanolyticus]|uniref:hypothetical protein n=1 Tax=Paracoccus mutanolyticus TaxID=1499308 RepID=UPI001679A7DE|nr:hypothetical protein [Paracoccus mutanolyticus]